MSDEVQGSEGRPSGDPERPRKEDVPVVGIGASAGGLEAYKRLLGSLPDSTGAAFVLIQHLDPRRDSMMAELLSRATGMPVLEVTDGLRVRADHVYMIPPNRYVRLEGDHLRLDEAVKDRGVRMPINHFFRSLGRERGERAICVVLSGTGTDGTLGLKEAKEQGALILAQSPQDAEYDGMPRSAIGTGLVDRVFELDEAGAVLRDLIDAPVLLSKSPISLDRAEPEHFNALLRLLLRHTDYDFRSYKRGTLNRRIRRRMGLRQARDLGEYVRGLEEEPEELTALFRDLLIGVTHFFRDPEAWAVLEDAVATILHGKTSPSGTFRAWVPGCASGEEAFSLAMVIFEQMEKQNKHLEVQIFGTDLDSEAIERARAGLYDSSIETEVPSERLRRFFEPEDDRYRVRKQLRESCIFAVQNVISDPPFSKLDLVSCRNLMIYLEAPAQRRMIEMFHFALRSEGLLFLGSSESVGPYDDLFEPVSRSHRLYRRCDTGIGKLVKFPIASVLERATSEKGGRNPVPREPSLDDLPGQVRDVLLDRFAPASVVIDRRRQIRYLHGPLRHYLDFPGGEPTHDLVDLARGDLRIRLRGLIRRALQEDARVTIRIPRVSRGDETQAVDVLIEAEPLSVGGSRGELLRVSFVDEEVLRPKVANEDGDGPPGSFDRDEAALEQLEGELRATRENLQSTIEELETSNEELKASNEEVMSMNEELQSTNEELETSREELQSLNEELSTVNTQLEHKIDETQAANDDLRNLLTSTEIATIFLDRDLRIRRFTPVASELFHVIDSDIGRPLGDLAPAVRDPDLLDHARRVLDKLVPVEQEVPTRDGRWFTRRVLPYRTEENRIDGVVVTLSDVTRLHHVVEQLESREKQQKAVAQLGRAALGGEAPQELCQRACELTAELLGTDFTKVLELNRGGADLTLRAGVGWNRSPDDLGPVSAGLESQAGYTLRSNGPVVVEDLAREKRFDGPPLLTDHGVVSGLSVLIGSQEAPWGVMGTHTATLRRFSVDDIHFVQAVANVLGEALERDRAAHAQIKNTQRLDLALKAGGLGVWEWDLESDVTTWNDGHYEMLGYEVGGVVPGYDVWRRRVHPEDRERVEDTVRRSLADHADYHSVYRVVWPDGSEHRVEARGTFQYDRDGEATHMYGVLLDRTGGDD